MNYSLRELVSEEAAGRDATVRKNIMLDYGNSVDAKNEVSLRDFRGGDDPASRAVGRGKAGLVLHALRRVVGEEAFVRAAGKILEKSPAAPLSWDDVRAVFEKEAGKDLGWFFEQWVDRKGLPDLLAENASVRRNGSRFEVSFDLSQKGDVYILDVPVVVSFVYGGGKTDSVRLDAGKKHVVLAIDDEPSVCEIDPEYDIPRKLTKTEERIRLELRKEPPAVEVSALKSLTQVIEAAAGKKIVYVGEYHDRFAHHAVQLQVIKDLHRRDPMIAVGMEMFQRPFQTALDEYISGSIDEREFLKRSEYFQRWGYDYNLYKPILDFARAEKIPVVALNLRREIVDKVSKSGMDSLTDEERKELPDKPDFSDSGYRERLRKVFAQHKGEKERNFDFFYQAQVLWDETMSMSIDEYLKKNPGRRMAVIAGEGHLAYGSGIPVRASRRGGYDYTVILNDADVERDIADYLVFPPALEGVTAPLLMVMLKDSGGKVVIEDLPQDSVSRKAGLKKGDTIVSLDGVPVKTAADVRVELFYKKREGEVRVKAVRRSFLLGERDMEFVVKLQ
ncbi:MAG: ChaN family lipoprotein [Nitrospirota bacterium]